MSGQCVHFHIPSFSSFHVDFDVLHLFSHSAELCCCTLMQISCSRAFDTAIQRSSEVAVDCWMLECVDPRGRERKHTAADTATYVSWIHDLRKLLSEAG